MVFAFGNFITQADIDGKGWRWVFWIAAMPGFVLGILMLFTLKEPARSERGDGKVSCVFTFYVNISLSMCTQLSTLSTDCMHYIVLPKLSYGETLSGTSTV